MGTKTYSTGAVAKKVGVSRQTLHNWIADGKIPTPNAVDIGGILTLLWSAEDVDRARKFKSSERKRGPKPKK
jgi:predicted DNA-binding transcriptional regulator AlpA